MVLPLRRYTQFAGRSSRREFWWYSLFLGLGYVGIALAWGVFLAVVQPPDPEELVGWYLGAGAAFFLANLVPGIALSVRRLHDIGQSGWWLLAAYAAMLFLSLIGWVPYLVVMSLPPQKHPNRWGLPVGPRPLASVFD
ncbi:MAG: DUF805 domain-containing protein [Sphingomonadales bacterium]|nr:DUF805 domain-containing protein [Sphingomonadales bacterium]MBD3772523.1 DUF805 domain-containing protein [Paracoccaceae bacterium]